MRHAASHISSRYTNSIDASITITRPCAASLCTCAQLICIELITAKLGREELFVANLKIYHLKFRNEHIEFGVSQLRPFSRMRAR